VGPETFSSGARAPFGYLCRTPEFLITPPFMGTVYLLNQGQFFEEPGRPCFALFVFLLNSSNFSFYCISSCAILSQLSHLFIGLPYKQTLNAQYGLFYAEIPLKSQLTKHYGGCTRVTPTNGKKVKLT